MDKIDLSNYSLEREDYWRSTVKTIVQFGCNPENICLAVLLSIFWVFLF